MMRQPRIHSEKHLQFIRGCPCVVCGDNTSTEAAHVRYGSLRAAKRRTGMQEKPSDCWTVPLCGAHHRKQHEMGEVTFWTLHGRDPIFIAALLWLHTGNQEAAEQVIRLACTRGEHHVSEATA
jgi:hypothetical protein